MDSETVDKAVTALRELLGFAPGWILVLLGGIALVRWAVVPIIRALRGRNGKSD